MLWPCRIGQLGERAIIENNLITDSSGLNKSMFDTRIIKLIISLFSQFLIYKNDCNLFRMEFLLSPLLFLGIDTHSH